MLPPMYEPRADCPAAHSMDTTWFAIDADGFVGAFETGEGGALPYAAAAAGEAGELDPWPLWLVVAARAIVDGSFPDAADGWGEPTTHAQDLLLVLVPDAEQTETSYRASAGATYSVQAELSVEVVVLEDTPRIVGTLEPVKPDELAALAADSRICRIVYADEIYEWGEQGGGSIHRFSNTEWGNPGQYERLNDPKDPISAGTLPDELDEAVSQLSLEVRFADAPVLHLANLLEEGDCYTWGETDLHGEPPEGAEAARTEARARRSRPTGLSQGLKAGLLILGIFALLRWLFWLLS